MPFFPGRAQPQALTLVHQYDIVHVNHIPVKSLILSKPEQLQSTLHTYIHVRVGNSVMSQRTKT